MSSIDGTGLRTLALAALAAALVLPVAAQTSGATAAPAAKPAAPAAPRARIELPAAERKALEAGAPASTPSLTASDLAPSAADAKPAEEPQTRIEQVRTGNRISEVRVTPALTGRTYTMTNREGRQPTSITEISPGLSVPKFFTFEWGRPDERPSPPLPPPPSSSTPR